jgi:hypothetical protein
MNTDRALRGQVIDVDDKQQRGQHCALGHTSRGGHTPRRVLALGDTEGTVGEERANPHPSFARYPSLVEQLEQEPVMRNTIKRFDNVKENNGQRFATTHGIAHLTLKNVEVIEGGEGVPETGLVVSEEVLALQKRHQPLLHDALKATAENTRDGDDAVSGGVRART